MGSSGTGKSTLLNALSQRLSAGRVSGEFLVDGRKLGPSFNRSAGFAEQEDKHEPTATVREALRFSAVLRQPREVSLEDKYAHVESIIELLEMRDIAGAVVDKVGEGLNPEQRKRLTIGVELAGKPELLMFLDGPTSGLDSGAAFNIVRLLKRLAGSGLTILCTIHQTSAVLFSEFDDLLLLQAGGKTVYHGELGKDSRTMHGYLEAKGAPRCPPETNPAEYMLEAIGAGNPGYSGQDWSSVWETSAEREQQSQEIARLGQSDEKSAGVVSCEFECAMPLRRQVSIVLCRRLTAYWRMPKYIYGKLLLHVFGGLLNSATFWALNNSEIAMKERLFSVFMFLSIGGPVTSQL